MFLFLNELLPLFIDQCVPLDDKKRQVHSFKLDRRRAPQAVQVL